MGRGCVELSRIMCSRGRLGRRRDVYHCLALSTMRTFLLPYRPGEVVKLTMDPGGEKEGTWKTVRRHLTRSP